MPIPYCCAVSKIIAWNPKAIHMSGGHFYQKVVFFFDITGKYFISPDRRAEARFPLA
jgi:hypothetical protein